MSTRLFFETLRPGDKIVLGPTDMEVATIQPIHTRTYTSQKLIVKFSYKTTRYCLEYCSKTDTVYLNLKAYCKMITPDMIVRASDSDDQLSESE
jgi:hypothetical protein